MTLGKFGPDARSKKHSLFNEISAEQMRSYTPQQIAVVLSQREDVSPSPTTALLDSLS